MPPCIDQGWKLLAEGRKVEAAALFRNCGDAPEAVAGLAVALLAERETAQALELSGRGLEGADTRLTRYARALACARGGELQEAGEHVARLSEQAGDWSGALHASGVLALSGGDRETAEALFSKVSGFGVGVLDSGLNLVQLRAARGGKAREDVLAQARTLAGDHPMSGQAWAVLARLLVRAGLHEEGVSALERARSLHPGLPSARDGMCELAALLAGAVPEPGLPSVAGKEAASLGRRLGRMLEAEVRGNDADWKTFIALGSTLNTRGETGRALSCLRRAVRLAPDSPLAHANLAQLLAAAGEAERAGAAALAAVHLSLDGSPAFLLALETLKTLGRAGELRTRMRRVVREDGGNPWGWYGLSIGLEQSGHIMGAYRAMRRARDLGGDQLAPLVSLGAMCNVIGRADEAADVLARARDLAPGNANIMCSLAVAIELKGDLEGSLAMLEEALEADPGCETALLNKARLLQYLGEPESSLACASDMARRFPGFHKGPSIELFTMHFSPAYSPEDIARAHRIWGDSIDRPGVHRPDITWDGKRPLRVGFVSGDFRNHATHTCLAQLFKGREGSGSRDRWLPHLYSNVAVPDAITRWYRAGAHVWRDIVSMGDDAVAELIRRDRLDVLIDLSGHIGTPRLAAFSHRPAPVQVSWLGYFNTSGCPFMDYLIADPVTIPPGAEGLYREKIVRLPHDFVCFDPPDPSPEVEDPPSLRNGHITLGSFNQIVKLNPEVASLWADILSDLPGARLVVQSRHFGNERARRNMEALFREAGVDRSRLHLLGKLPRFGMLSAYRRLDIALDPFPCAGGVTTLEALWMGVPVVTLMGDRFCGRHSAAHVTTAGFSELVAGTREEYRKTVISLANDPGRLAGYRQGLRPAMQASPMCDGAAFFVHFSDLLERMARLE